MGAGFEVEAEVDGPTFERRSSTGGDRSSIFVGGKATGSSSFPFPFESIFCFLLGELDAEAVDPDSGLKGRGGVGAVLTWSSPSESSVRSISTLFELDVLLMVGGMMGRGIEQELVSRRRWANLASGSGPRTPAHGEFRIYALGKEMISSVLRETSKL